MTELFRQKLLNWITSMSVLILVTVLAVLFVLLVRFPQYIEMHGEEVWIVGFLAGPFFTYPIFFLPLFVWHVCDFFQRDVHHKEAHFLSRYRTMALTTGIALFAIFWINTGIFEVSDCPPFPWDSLPYSCSVRPARWLQFMFYGPLLFSLFLCMAKLAITVSSFRKTPE